MKTSQYQLLLEIQDVAKINVVTCAHCSAGILHRLDEEEIQCYDCNEVLDPSACPDIFHEELPITEQKPKYFMVTDKSGRSMKPYKMDKSHIQKHFDLTQEDWNSEQTLGEYLTESAFGENWETENSKTECITE